MSPIRYRPRVRVFYSVSRTGVITELHCVYLVHRPPMKLGTPRYEPEPVWKGQ